MVLGPQPQWYHERKCEEEGWEWKRDERSYGSAVWSHGPPAGEYQRLIEWSLWRFQQCKRKSQEFGPALPPTGHVTPVTPATMPSGIMPPPAAPPMAPPMAPPQPALPVATFAGYSPAKVGELPMTCPANLDVKYIKSPAFQVVDESTGNVRCVSPTRRHNPATGTAAFAPLGYVVLKNTNDYRRVYP